MKGKTILILAHVGSISLILYALIISLLSFDMNFFIMGLYSYPGYVNVSLIMLSLLYVVSFYLSLTGKGIPIKYGKKMKAGNTTISFGIVNLIASFCYLILASSYPPILFWFIFVLCIAGIISVIGGISYNKLIKSEENLVNPEIL